jgi:hypothetical protein
MAEFRACYTSRKAVVADADRLVFEGVGKVIFAFGHCSHEDANRFLWADGSYVIVDPDNLCVKTESDFPTVGREVVGNGILDHFE